MLDALLQNPTQIEGVFLNHGQLVVLLRLCLTVICGAGIWLLIRIHHKLLARWKISTFQPEAAAIDLNISALWVLTAALCGIGLWSLGTAIERLMSPQYFLIQEAAGWSLFLTDLF